MDHKLYCKKLQELRINKKEYKRLYQYERKLKKFMLVGRPKHLYNRSFFNDLKEITEKYK